MYTSLHRLSGVLGSGFDAARVAALSTTAKRRRRQSGRRSGRVRGNDEHLPEHEPPWKASLPPKHGRFCRNNTSYWFFTRLPIPLVDALGISRESAMVITDRTSETPAYFIMTILHGRIWSTLAAVRIRPSWCPRR